MSNRNPLVVRLKSGEYDGADLMKAWLLIEDQAKRIEELELKLKNTEWHLANEATLHADAEAQLEKVRGLERYEMRGECDEAFNGKWIADHELQTILENEDESE